MKKLFLSALMGLLALSTLVYADNTAYTCLDLNISEANVTIYNGTDGTVLVQLQENVTCRYGCNNATGECNPTPYDIKVTDVGIMIIPPIVAFILLYFGVKQSDDHWALQILMIGMAFFILTGELAILHSLATVTQSHIAPILLGMYQAVMWTGIIVVLYYIILMIIRAVGILKVKPAG